MKRQPTKHGIQIEKLYGRHEGETIIVIGNSISLEANDLVAFEEFTTIGVNRILRTYTPTYTFVVDRSVIECEHDRMNKADTEVLMWPGAMTSRHRKLYVGPWYGLPKMTSHARVTDKKGALHIPPGGNSGYEAVQIAYRMGASRIVMAGIDMEYPRKGPSHFFGDGRKEGCKLPLVQEKIDAFIQMKASYDEVGVELFSVSPWQTRFRDKMGYLPQSEL